MQARNVAERSAECSCGQLRVTVRAKPLRVSVCHCLACQRRTGSVFGAQARFPLDSASIAGRSTVFTRVGDSGITISFNFCPECGSTVYYTLDSQPDVVAIPVGAFADPGFPEPSVSFYESREPLINSRRTTGRMNATCATRINQRLPRKHSWASVPQAAEHFDD